MLRKPIFQFRSTPPPAEAEQYEERMPALEECLMQMTRFQMSVRLYVDTCSLLHPDGMFFLQAMERAYIQYHTPLLIFSSILNELEHVGKKDIQKRVACQNVIRRLREMERADIVRVCISENLHFSDVNFISSFIQDMQTSNIIFISQDAKLCETAKGLKSFLSSCIQSEYSISVFYLKNHTLEPAAVPRQTTTPFRQFQEQQLPHFYPYKPASV